MFWSILQRTILWELVKVFVLALVGMTGILVLAGVVPQASQQGLNPMQVLAIIPLLVPSMMPYAIPTTTLFATCVVYGRLAHDNEILALKAAGISILKVIRPALLLGVLTSITTMGLYYQLIPYTQYLIKSAALNDVEEFLYAILKRDHEFNLPSFSYVMFVREVRGRRLEGALFKRRDGKGGYDLVASAREAELRVDMNKNEVHVDMRGVEVLTEGKEKKEGNVGRIDQQVWTVPLPAMNTQRVRRCRELSWPELLVRHQEVFQERDVLDDQIREVEANLAWASQADHPELHLQNLKNERLMRQYEANALHNEMYMRPVLSCGCFFFVLVGCPIGIWFSKSDYLSAFITCFLPIVFLYYPMILCGGNLVKDGKVHPALGLWAANVTIGLIALVLFRRLLKN